MDTIVHPLGVRMKVVILSFLFLVFGTQELIATTYIPVPLDQQLKESSGVIQGRFLGKIYKRLASGQIVTEMSFHVERSVGLASQRFLNSNELKVLVPGGVWQDIVYDVQGAPTFTEGEEVVLLVKESSDGLWPMNLALGKYHMIKQEGRTWLVSDVFPDHPRLGHVASTDFERLVQDSFGENLKAIDSDKVVVSRRIERPSEMPGSVHRVPASQHESNQEDETPGNPAAVALVLGLMVLITSLWRIFGKKLNG